MIRKLLHKLLCRYNIHEPEEGNSIGFFFTPCKWCHEIAFVDIELLRLIESQSNESRKEVSWQRC